MSKTYRIRRYIELIDMPPSDIEGGIEITYNTDTKSYGKICTLNIKEGNTIYLLPPEERRMIVDIKIMN